MLLIDILDRDNEDKNDNQVQIITMHASKGLEFKKSISWEWKRGYYHINKVLRMIQ